MIDTSRQKQLFEEIHDQYYQSSTDAYSMAFKDEFMHRWLLSHLGQGSNLIELACGVGATSGWLARQRSELIITGCDISERAAQDFGIRHGRPCIVADLTKPFDIGETFDTVLIMGGIHHLVADLNTAFTNILNLLNSGGRLLMAEPNADYMLEPFRKLWYRLDKSSFDVVNEHALSHETLFRNYGNGFRVLDLGYFGGPAYFLLSLNWILRIPNRSKKWTAPILMSLERFYNRLPGKLPFAFFLACWEKT